jgi:hydrogenase maturation protease
MNPTPVRCLILACGNTLRSDDGVGPWLAEWAEQRFRNEPRVRVITRQQWTPELAEEIAAAGAVLFLDCSIAAAPGELRLAAVEPSQNHAEPGTHHLGAAELLALSRGLYATLPREAMLLTIGAGSTELGERFSDAVRAALPAAQRRIEETIQHLIG